MLSDELPIGPIEALKQFFGSDGKPVTREELEALGKALGIEAIKELGAECAKALGKPYRAPS